jgi:hypothetical protein
MMKSLSHVLRSLAHKNERFFSGSYWEQRYAEGDYSGQGSRDILAEYKAKFVADVIDAHGITSLIDFGCGDGLQLNAIMKKLKSPLSSYIGLDVSPTVLRLCSAQFSQEPIMSFALYSPLHAVRPERFLSADMTLSLDVIYHLVEDDVYDAYMRQLFDCSKRLVLVYSSNLETQGKWPKHVRHRRFTSWVEQHRPQWTLAQHVPNPYPHDAQRNVGTFADFYVFGKAPDQGPV